MISNADHNQALEELRSVASDLAAAYERAVQAGLLLDSPQVPKPYSWEIVRAAAWVYNARNVFSIVAQRFEEMEVDSDA